MNNTRKITTIILLFTLIGLFITGLFVEFLIFSGEVNQLKEQISTLQNQVDNMHTTINYQNVTYILGKNISLSELYENVKESIVVISGIVVSYQFPFTSYYEVQGSGFVYNFTRQMVIITNYHVVNGAINITVTFLTPVSVL
jgi:S1-C subfamily serine protease